MKQDKVLQKIHQTQTRLRKKHKGLSWNKEVKLINRIVKRVTRKYNYQVFPLAKKPHVLFRINSPR